MCSRTLCLPDSLGPGGVRRAHQSASHSCGSPRGAPVGESARGDSLGAWKPASVQTKPGPATEPQRTRFPPSTSTPFQKTAEPSTSKSTFWTHETVHQADPRFDPLREANKCHFTELPGYPDCVSFLGLRGTGRVEASYWRASGVGDQRVRWGRRDSRDTYPESCRCMCG